MYIRKMYSLHIITILIVGAIVEVELAKILGVFPTSSRNHFELGSAMMKQLANRGHHVTVVSPFKERTIENYTNIVLMNIFSVDDFPENLHQLKNPCPISSIKYIHRKSLELTESLLGDPNFQTLLQSGEKFNVVVLEYLLNEAVLGIGQIFDSPIVLFSPYPSSTLNDHLFSNPAPSSFVPNPLTGYTGVMDFWQRANNVIFNSFNNFYRHYFVLPEQEKLLKKYIDRDIQLEDAMQNVSLMLLNSHPSISEPVPHTPSMIEVAGFHVNPNETLPYSLKYKLDDAINGVVFVTKTGFNADELYTITRMLSTCLTGMGLEVIYETESFDERYDNGRFIIDFPRQAVLAHPSTKLVVSNGGLHNIIEATYFKIPVLAISSHKDQALEMAVKNGYAISLSHEELSQERLTTSLVEILSNSWYRINAQRRSEIMKDQPIKPLDSTIYWIEYTMKHEGAKHLQSPGVFLKWYQRNLIDLILILTILEIVLFLIFYYIFKHIIHHAAIKMKDRKAKQYDKL